MSSAKTLSPSDLRACGSITFGQLQFGLGAFQEEVPRCILKERVVRPPAIWRRRLRFSRIQDPCSRSNSCCCSPVGAAVNSPSRANVAGQGADGRQRSHRERGTMNDEHMSEYEVRGAMLEPMPISKVQRQPLCTVTQPTEPRSRRVDEALEGSFPASDPPPWTSGIARPSPDGEPPRHHGRHCEARSLAPVADADVLPTVS